VTDRSFGSKGRSNVGIPEHFDQVFRVTYSIYSQYPALIFTKCSLCAMRPYDQIYGGAERPPGWLTAPRAADGTSNARATPAAPNTPEFE
jgi:hypothetical protein